MRLRKMIPLVFFSSFAVLLLACADDPSPSDIGTVSVLVLDNLAPADPVADVEITIQPGGLVLKTDQNGLAVFELSPGQYFVDAEVCCAGPGFIEYHEAVTVVSGETTEVLLAACLVCVC